MNKWINKLKNLLKKYRLDPFVDVGVFMIILIIFHFLWKLLDQNLMAIGFIDNSASFLAKIVFDTSEWLVHVFNLDVFSSDEYEVMGAIRKNVFYYAETNGYVYVNRSCSGLKQFYQWTFLMLLYPGPWKKKIWFIPLGLVITHLVNITRIMGMILVTMHMPDKWDMMHDNVFRPLFYVVMFAMWVFWNEKFYLKQAKNSK